MNTRISKYQQAQKELPLSDANPHQVIQILMRELLSQVYQARVCIERTDIEGKNKSINKAIKIVGGLQGGLNLKEGAEIAGNLDSLYNYITVRLTDANAENSIEILDEVKDLFFPIKEAWDNISESDKALGIKLISEAKQ